MYVFSTPYLDEQAKEHSLEDRIASFEERIENAQTKEEAKQRFNATSTGHNPYLRQRMDFYRLVGRIKEVRGTPVVCLYRVFWKDAPGRDASKWFDDLDTERRKEEMEKLIEDSQEALEAFVEERKAEERARERLPDLPDDFRHWLQPPSWRLRQTERVARVVYETEVWKDKVAGSDYWQSFYDNVYEIVFKTSPEVGERGGFEEIPGQSHLYLNAVESRYVLFSELSVKHKEEKDKATPVLFLVAALDGRPTPEEVQRTVEQLDLEGVLSEARETSGSVRAECLLPRADRAYPEDVTHDRETWRKIQFGTEEANLALSTEEEDLLEAIADPSTGSGRSLPLFISGRAGSGKSTMLLYLFSDYCYRKLSNSDLPGAPLFVTYNERLLERTQADVRARLNLNAAFLAGRDAGDVGSEGTVSDEDLASYFWAFQKLLRDLLPGEGQQRFARGDYVGYARFKEAYTRDCKLPEARAIQPGLAWHVIRSFIKGYFADGFMNPDEYAGVDRKERSVTPENFQRIHDTIWKQWYERFTVENQLWDDQDLVRDVLGQDEIPTYPVVFCDEAQDFTRVELQFIRRLSVYSRHDFDLYGSEYLPFAFAGDPLQTLNPTGFRWERLRSSFHDEVSRHLGTSTSSGVDLDEIELVYNYRSSRPIVDVCNLILSWRRRLFGTSMNLQKAWSPEAEDGSAPRRIVAGRSVPDDMLREFLALGRTILIPCEQGKETEYVRNDPLLSEIVDIDPEGEEPLQDVMSSAEAKGLDLDQVVVYKFGDFLLRDRLARREGAEAASLEIGDYSLGEVEQEIWSPAGEIADQRIEHEYFFNKLYVAASRARDHLIVVDTEPGDRCLWSRANRSVVSSAEEYDIRSESDDRVESGEAGPFVAPIPEGDQMYLSEITDPDPKHYAEEYKRRGIAERDPDDMRRAKQKYQAIDDYAEARRCEALASRYEAEQATAADRKRERYEKAGSIFCDWSCPVFADSQQLAAVSRSWCSFS